MVVLENVSKIYQVNSLFVPALTDFHLTIFEGEMLAVMGPSGSGKTTLLNLLGCLDVPTSGRLLFRGKEIQQMNPVERAEFRRTHIGFVFQMHNLIPVLTAEENVLLSFWIRGWKEEDAIHQVKRMFSLLGLEGLMQRKPTELSGGQQQRVAIARALAGNPDLLLADEPTANLDSTNACALMHWLKKMNEEMRVSIVFATHDPDIARTAQKILYLQDGKLRSIENL